MREISKSFEGISAPYYVFNVFFCSLKENPIDPPMEWGKRLSVAGMVAEGLAHLHKHKVVHGNVKTSNVLMDRNGNPLVADYGFAQLAFVDLSTNMKMMRYMAPEVNDLRRAQPSADVYSFGVVLLELITGRRAIDYTKPASEQNLINWVRICFSLCYFV